MPWLPNDRMKPLLLGTNFMKQVSSIIWRFVTWSARLRTLRKKDQNFKKKIPGFRSNCRLPKPVSTQSFVRILLCHINFWDIFPSGSPEDHTRLIAAAQALVDVVDIEEESSSNNSLVERLEEAPHKFFDVMTATSKNYLTHMIGVVKSYLPQFNLAPIAKGITPSCSDEKFREYCKESEVIAEEILKNMAE